LATLDELSRLLVELEEDQALEAARSIVAEGSAGAAAVLAACQQALRVVGERYERKDYALAALIMSGELFKEIMEIIEPLQTLTPLNTGLPTVLLGTVSGDIHDIGKSIFRTALTSYGFEVIDLGVDVPKERFLHEVLVSRPAIVCFSGLIAVAFQSMRATIRLIKSHEDQLGYRPHYIIGGATVDSRVAEYVEADSWSTDAMEGVRICQNLIGR
jgi:dimethylamine corrinoid protein